MCRAVLRRWMGPAAVAEINAMSEARASKRKVGVLCCAAPCCAVCHQ